MHDHFFIVVRLFYVRKKFLEKSVHNNSYRWVIFSGVFAVYLGFGMVAMSLAPLVGEIRSDLNLTRGEMGIALGTWQLIYIGTSPIAGRMVDRLGVEYSLAIGAFLVLISGITRSLVHDLPTLCLTVALFGVGGPLVSACAPTAAGLWFTDERERKFTVGAFTVAPVVGSIAVLIMSNSLLMPLTGSWRWTIAIEALVIAFALLFWVFIAEFKVQKDPDNEKAESKTFQIWKSIVVSKEIKVIFLLGVTVFFLSHGLGGWMPEILREHSGFSSMAASNWTAASLGIGIFVSLLLPPRTRRENFSSIFICTLLVVVLSLIAIIFLPSYMTPIAVMIAGSRSALIPLVILALMESPKLNIKQMGTAYGLWFASAEIGGVLGPVSAGRIADSTFGYDGVLWLMIAVCLMMILLAYALLIRTDESN
tara:strand:- start:433 stop:1698 length:1266 start_codon:yes stop_codon:yes gene_type:complete